MIPKKGMGICCSPSTVSRTKYPEICKELLFATEWKQMGECSLSFYLLKLSIILMQCTQYNINLTLNNNSPFPSSHKPLHQSEAWCTTIHMNMSLTCMWMKSHYHMKGRVRRLALLQLTKQFLKRVLIQFCGHNTRYSWNSKRKLDNLYKRLNANLQSFPCLITYKILFTFCKWNILTQSPVSLILKIIQEIILQPVEPSI